MPPCGSPTCKSGGLDLIERLLATDIKDVQRRSRSSSSRRAIELGYQGITINVGNGDKAKGPLGQIRKVRQALDLAIDREALNQVVFNGEFVPGNQWVSPDNPYYQKSIPGSEARCRQGQGADEGSRRHDADHHRLHGAARAPRTRRSPEVVQAMAAEAGFDMKIRVTEFATSLKQAEAGRVPGLSCWPGAAAPIPTATSISS